MVTRPLLFFLTFVLICSSIQAQDNLPVKIKHAEPINIDLIRDLGARKGEKEWNAGWATQNHSKYASHTAFVEYEFAPVNGLGLEVEVPVTFYHTNSPTDEADPTPRSRVEGIKLATQYSFLVSEKYQLTLAAGYIHEFRIHSFHTIKYSNSWLKGNSFNPFFVAAKRFGRNIHTLLYTGPSWESTRHGSSLFTWSINTSIHYMLPSKHFIGLEVNEEISKREAEIVARPQVKIVMTPRFALGFATGIPVHMPERGLSFLMRMIYEPRN